MNALEHLQNCEKSFGMGSGKPLNKESFCNTTFSCFGLTERF